MHAGLKLSMPVEKSGQNEFDFQVRGRLRRPHREATTRTSPRCSSAYNPDDPDTEMNDAPAGSAQGARGLAARARPQVPVRAAGARHRRSARLGRRRQSTATTRSCDPELMRRAIEDTQQLRAARSTSGRSRALTSAPTPRCSPSRLAPAPVDGGVTCVLLGRGAVDREGRAVAADRHRPSTDSSASRSGARSGGTRSRAGSPTSLTARRRSPRWPITTCISSRSTRARRSRDADIRMTGRTVGCVPSMCTNSCTIGRLGASR